MINVRDFLKCVNFDDVAFTINGESKSFHSEDLYKYYTNDELSYLYIVRVYVDPNDMIMVVVNA